jgi:tetratricopeptide (TPR) repeat protein
MGALLLRGMSKPSELAIIKTYNLEMLAARRLVSERRFADASVHFDSALKVRPFDLPALLESASARYQMEDYAPAVGLYRRASKVALLGTNARFQYAEALRLTESPEDSLVQYDLSVHLDPRQCLAHLGGAYAAVDVQNFAGAVERSNLALACDPQLTDGFRVRGNAHYELKEFSQALSDYAEYLRVYYDAPWVHDRVAEIYDLLGRDDLSAAEYRIAASQRWERVDSIGSYLNWLFGH